MIPRVHWLKTRPAAAPEALPGRWLAEFFVAGEAADVRPAICLLDVPHAPGFFADPIPLRRVNGGFRVRVAVPWWRDVGFQSLIMPEPSPRAMAALGSIDDLQSTGGAKLRAPAPPPLERRQLLYRSSWPAVRAGLYRTRDNGAPRFFDEFLMERAGRGRSRGESEYRLNYAYPYGAPLRFFFFGTPGQEDHPGRGGDYVARWANAAVLDGEVFRDGFPQKTHAPRIEELTLPAPGFDDATRVRVYMPRNGDYAPRGLPVLFLLDGQNQFGGVGPHGGWQADLTATDCIARGEWPEILLVAVDYPQARGDAYRLPGEGKRGGDYLDWLAGPLYGELRRRYRVRPGAAHTGIAGSSRAGVLALYAALVRPATFGRAAAISPALDNAALFDCIRALPERPRGGRIYLDSGNRLTAENREFDDHATESIRLRDLLLDKGYLYGLDLFHRVALGHEHNESFWRVRLADAVSCLFEE